VAAERRRLYRIAFLNQGQVYEIYARKVVQGGLLGFVQVEDLVFGEKTRVVVDPGEERLQQEFEGVKRCFIPMHALLRIDEVERPGPSRITDAGGKGTVAPFPVTLIRPPSGSGT
jgi:hypothetical protein